MNARTQVMLLMVGALTLAAPEGARAQTYAPGADVLIRYKGLMTRAWVVAPAAGNRSVVAMTWDTRKLKVLPNSALKPGRGPGIASSRKRLKGWTAHAPGLYRVDTAANGRFMAAAPHKGAIQVFRQDVLLPLIEIPRAKRVDGLGISPDGKKLAACASDGTLSVYALPTGKRVRTRNLGAGCRYLTFGPGGTLAVETAKKNMAVRLYNVDSDKLSPPQMRIRTSGQTRSALRFSGDGKWLLDARASGKRFRGKRGVRVYAVNGLELSLKRILRGPADASSLGVSRDGAHVAGGGADGTVMVWRTGTGRLLWSKKLGLRAAQVDVARDGSAVAVCGRKGKPPVKLLRGRDGQLLANLGDASMNCSGVRFAHGDRVVYASATLYSNMGEIAVYRYGLPDALRAAADTARTRSSAP